MSSRKPHTRLAQAAWLKSAGPKVGFSARNSTFPSTMNNSSTTKNFRATRNQPDINKECNNYFLFVTLHYSTGDRAATAGERVVHADMATSPSTSSPHRPPQTAPL